MKVSIIIPCKNEAERLPDTIERLEQFYNEMVGSGFSFETIFVENGSTDQTTEVIQRLIDRGGVFSDQNARLIHSAPGKGYAIKAGLELATGEYVLFYDADNSTDIGYLKEMLQIISHQPEIDIVNSSRKIGHKKNVTNQTRLRQFCGNIFSLIVKCFFRIGITDTQNGFKLVKRKSALRIFEKIKTHGWVTEVEFFLYAQQLKMKVLEIPILWINNKRSSLKLSSVFGIAKDLLQIRFGSGIFKTWLPIIVLLGASLITHFLFFGYPKEAVFDEVHFTSFISSYITHEYFFDIHPPFAKLLIGGFGMILGIPALTTHLSIGDALPDGGWILLRLIPLLAGTVLPLVIYFLCLKFRIGKISAFTAGMLIILENSLLVQSRFILLDSLLLLFGFSALCIFFIARNSKCMRKRVVMMLKISSVFLCSFAFSIKWTGMTFLALIFLIEIRDFFVNKNYRIVHYIGKEFLLKLLVGALLYVVLPICIYASFFALHFAILTKSGEGDAFMSPQFQHTLEGNSFENDTAISNPSFIEKFTELNIRMLQSNIDLDATHDYGSSWNTWPLMQRSVFYWESKVADKNAYVYLLGNPFVYLLAFCGIIFLTLQLVIQKMPTRKNGFETSLGIFLVFGYLFNLLPFMGIGRVMFLYHYEVALIFGILAVAFLIDQLKFDLKKQIAFSLIVISLVFFVWFAPLSYGIPITVEHMPKLFWITSWR